jgi:response regulator RpfG family c-di-GMP phosphodiesterase
MSRVTSRNLHAGYIEIPISDYSHLKTHPFDVFVEDQNRGLRLFASKGSAVDPAYLQELKKQTSWLFIEEKAVSTVRSRIREVQSEYQDLEGFPVAWKTAEILFNARMLLKSIQAGGISDGAVEQAGKIIGDLLQLVSHLGQTPNLRRLVQQAKESDKNVACTTLAVLICKILKFETVSVTEILGVASFFQDIGLYHTPFGDLSATPVVKMSEEAAKWYVNHPNESADLLAKNANLPEVVLQVIRQHHERKDRSGFPNKVGGLQLHPMAEILSLINTYLDLGTAFGSQAESIYSHYSERASRAFMTLLNQMESP